MCINLETQKIKKEKAGNKRKREKIPKKQKTRSGHTDAKETKHVWCKMTRLRHCKQGEKIVRL